MIKTHRLSITLLALLITCGSFASPSHAADLMLTLRHQVETASGSSQFHRLTRTEQWSPQQTAIIVCDCWDSHHCLNAVRRLEQIAPRLNEVLVDARQRGVAIIHAPSGCMDTYAEHPARLRASATPRSKKLPEEINSWCHQIPEEERGRYPIDQSDGGEDDNAAEHAEWEKKLVAMGRKPKSPWQAQIESIAIDPERDFISDKGDEIWNILEHREIHNVILTGVHTNMCVLGRPFGLRQMARNGRNVVLMRDMTDTMYNPAQWPYVSHFTGTDLIVSHIEKFVCPTITSDQLIGGVPFRFRKDTRPHLVILIAEKEYRTNETLPKFASEHLGKHFRVSTVFEAADDRNSLPGLEVLDDADAMLVSVRRRVLPVAGLRRIRRFVESGKPVVGIRTASHAFSLRNEQPPDGYADWLEFDATVFGGNYHNHHGNQLKSVVRLVPDVEHAITTGITQHEFAQGGSLYRTSPLKTGARVLLTGHVEGHPPEPAAWTFTRADGGRSFYTSMGHIDDFRNPAFLRLLNNGIRWACEVPLDDDFPAGGNE